MKAMKFLVLSGCLLVIGWQEFVAADVCTFQYGFQVAGSENTSLYTGAKDTLLSAAATDRNFGTTWPLFIRGAQTGLQGTGLFGFSGIQDYLPEGARVTSVRMGLTSCLSYLTSDLAYNVASVLKSWVEGTGGNPTTTEATWNTTGTEAWAAGGALGATDIGSIMDTEIVPGTTVDGDVTWFDIDADVVQGWLDNPTSNLGVLVWTNVESSRYWGVVSKEAAGGSYPSQRPILEVTYDVPEPATIALLCVGLGGYVAIRKKR